MTPNVGFLFVPFFGELSLFRVEQVVGTGTYEIENMFNLIISDNANPYAPQIYVDTTIPAISLFRGMANQQIPYNLFRFGFGNTRNEAQSAYSNNYFDEDYTTNYWTIGTLGASNITELYQNLNTIANVGYYAGPNVSFYWDGSTTTQYQSY
jgi:hypothetical protein